MSAACLRGVSVTREDRNGRRPNGALGEMKVYEWEATVSVEEGTVNGERGE